jgi:hypothetical protein
MAERHAKINGWRTASEGGPYKGKEKKNPRGRPKAPLRGELAEEFDGDFGYVFALVAGNF